MAKLHRRIVDSSAPRGPRIPAPRVTRRFPRLGGVRRPRFSLPGFAIFTPAIPWARMLPGRRGVMNFAVAGSLVFCGYAALLLIRDIQERPPAPILERPVAVSTPARFTPVPEGERIRVEVLNGVGVPGIAGALAEKLREQNFDVVAWKNYRTFNVRETFVIDRIGNPEPARRVAAYLETDVIQQARADSLLDVSVVLGRDYRSLKAFR